MVKAGEFNRSVEKFNDFAEQLIESGFSNFEQSLSMFLDLMERDRTLSIVHQQLLEVAGVDFDVWFQDRMQTGGSYSGSKSLVFPPEEEKRMALTYELLRRVNSGAIDLLNFCVSFFPIGSTKFDPLIREFNKVIVSRFIKDVKYRLDEISDQLPTDPLALVPPAMIQVINNAKNVIQQSAQGNNITQSANIQVNEQMDKLFEELVETLKDNIQNADELGDALDVVEAAKNNAESSSPKRSVVRSLLGALPPVGNVLTIASAIVSMV